MLPRNALHSLTARRHQRSTTRECSCADQSSHYKISPSTPHAARSENPPPPTSRIHLQALRRSRSVSRPNKDSFDSSTRSKGFDSKNSTLPWAIATSPVSQLPSFLLAMSSRVYLLFPSRGHEPPPNLRDRINPHLSLTYKTVAFQSSRVMYHHIHEKHHANMRHTGGDTRGELRRF